ncbi:hypothetical protein SAMN05216344_106129 [Polaromonas sp. OV174]|uniref:hypothetical protein n=1 Tax=Polaromonas sp. OV174 TaxID=1855300 RepID=UPI0008E27E93|nr:hypothetical protein [Polaromonas sp. OV174]SFB96794.1 hypothetical protein SAMN05216344_106129 [Polaromonas sp. OV174]
MNILLPTLVTPAMFGAGTTIPAVDAAAGEVEWVLGGSYVVGARRVWEGWIYECTKDAPASTLVPGTGAAAATWLRERPSNRMAPFDEYLYTKAEAVGELTYVLQPGFVTGLAIYAAEADRLQLWVKDEPDGVDLIDPIDQDLWSQAYGEFEYLFGDLQRATKHTLQGLPMRPNAEITIKLSRNNPAEKVAVGYIQPGQWRTLLSPLSSTEGGTEYGADVAPKSYSYYKRNNDGTYARIAGRRATNISASVQIGAAQAPAAKSLLDRILDIPVPIEASSLPRYSHISTVGFVTGSVTAENWATARVNLKIEGNV